MAGSSVTGGLECSGEWGDREDVCITFWPLVFPGSEPAPCSTGPPLGYMVKKMFTLG